MRVTEFLLARIAEDEERARDFEHDMALGMNGDYGNWDACHGAGYTWRVVERIGQTPARVLAECAAKRAIIELHKNESWNIPIDQDPHVEYVIGSDSASVTVITDGVKTGHIPVSEYLERVGATKNPPAKELRALAAIYENHPDYRQEWKL